MFLYKNIVFPAEADISYFSADLWLKYLCEYSMIKAFSVFECTLFFFIKTSNFGAEAERSYLFSI